MLAFVVVVLGATVRLSDAGLSCPDWPGCYGQPTVAAALARPAAERMQQWPGQPLDAARAQIEMLHRYAAGTLGGLVLMIGMLGRRRPEARVIAPALIGLVLLQVLLGMWTVTLRLEPLVVTAHLTGGLALLGSLWWLVLRDRGGRSGFADARGRFAEASDRLPQASNRLPQASNRLPQASARDEALGSLPEEGLPEGSLPEGGFPARRTAVGSARLGLLAVVALLTLAAQLVLGGWVAANQSALACQGFPTCNGHWLPALDMAAGFSPLSGGFGADGDAVLSGAGRIAIHWTHRLGAALVLLIVGTLALLAGRASMPASLRWRGRLLGVLLLTQIGVGIATVLAGAPLALAIAHNAVAALLLLALLTLVHQLASHRQPVADQDASSRGLIDAPIDASIKSNPGPALAQLADSNPRG